MSKETTPPPSTGRSILKFLKPIWKWASRAYLAIAVVLGSYVLIVTFLIVSALFSGEGDLDSIPLQEEIIRAGHEESEDVVAVVDISGPMFVDDTSDEFSFSAIAVSSDKVIAILDELDQAEQVKAIVLKINSPGGSAVAADEIYQKVLDIRKRKPVVAHFSEIAGSGGYYVGAAANEIVAHQNTITGSIGVIFSTFELSELYETFGITANTIKSGEYKDIGSFSREMTPEERDQLQVMVNSVYDDFVEAIETGRNVPRSKFESVADGRLLTADQALEAQLIDQIGTFDQSIDRAIALADLDDPAVVKYLDQSFFERLFSGSAGGVLPRLLGIPSQPKTSSQAGFLFMMEI